MRVEAEVIKGRGLGWTLGMSACSVGLLAYLATQSSVSAMSFVAIGALVTILSFFALTRGGSRRWGRKCHVGADSRGLSVNGELILPRQSIRSAHVKDEPEGKHYDVIIDARGFVPTHTVRVESARIAQVLSDTLEQEQKDLAEFDALPPWAHRMRWLAIVMTTSPWILLNVMRHMPGFVMLGIVALYALIGLPMIIPQKVSIGEDGLLLKWAGRRRFIPFGAIYNARVTPLGVELDLTIGRALEIRMTHRAEAEASRAQTMLQRIRDGIEKHRELAPAEDEALLARGERRTDAWIQEMTLLGAGDLLGYRAMAIPRERLWAVLENPRAAPSAREGAALALRERLDDDERKRIEALAQKSASPRLRIAIDAVSQIAEPARLRVVLDEAEERDLIQESKESVAGRR